MHKKYFILIIMLFMDINSAFGKDTYEELQPKVDNKKQVSLKKLVTVNNEVLKNFIKLKAGLAFPIPSSSNANIASIQKSSFFALEAGKNFAQFLSLSLEYIYKTKNNFNFTENNTTEYSWSNNNTNALMANLRADLISDDSLLSKSMLPYLKIGAGVARNNSANYIVNESGVTQQNYQGKLKNNFAWQVGFGLSFPFSGKFSTDISYTYADFGRTVTQILSKNQAVYQSKYANLSDQLFAVAIGFNF